MQKTTRRKGTPHLKLRGRTYHAVMEIPKDLRKRLGKRRFMATLGTDSLQVAQRRVVRQIAMWRKQITEARGEGGDANEDDPAYWRRALRNAKDEHQRQMNSLEGDIYHTRNHAKISLSIVEFRDFSNLRPRNYPLP